jgi:large subunit ribosomal protein L22
MAQVIKKSTIKTQATKIKTVDKPVSIKPVEKVKAIKKPVVKPVEKTETVFKTAKYLNKNIQISPRKLRLMVDEIRKFSPVEALERIKFINNKSSRILVQALKNIIADAKNNFNLDTNSLKFDTIKADEALKIKRMDKSHGSHFARGLMQKRHSRLVIIVKGVQK